MNSTNENNSVILRQFIENPTSIKKGSIIHQSVSQEDLSLLMLFNRNNPNASSVISNASNVDNFLTRANQELTNLRKSYGDIYVEKLGTVNPLSNSEVADAILTGKTTFHGNTFECKPTTNVLDDMENLIHGKDYIEHFSNKTPNDVFRQTQTGDVANINGKMYVNDGNSMVQLALSEESFRELFPPVKRFSLHQGSVGTCYLDTSINILANSKKGRAKLYQMVGEETRMGANGPERVFYTTTANGNGQKTYFERFTRSDRNLRDKNGLALIEQGFCMNSQRHALDHSNVTRIMEANESGNGINALRGLTGDIGIQIHNPTEMREKIIELAGRDDVFMYASSKDLNGRGHDHWINRNYDVAQTHAYTVKGYDASTDCVIISNPWHSGIQTSIPMNEFLNSFRRIDLAQIM